jgi:hypothetical protein
MPKGWPSVEVRLFPYAHALISRGETRPFRPLSGDSKTCARVSAKSRLACAGRRHVDDVSCRRWAAFTDAAVTSSTSIIAKIAVAIRRIMLKTSLVLGSCGLARRSYERGAFFARQLTQVQLVT